MAQGANDPANSKLIKGAGCGTRQWNEDFVLTDSDGVTPLFKVALADGTLTAQGVTSISTNLSLSGTLGVTGASTLHATTATTVGASGLITSTVAAGSPVIKFIATNATPTVAFTGNGSTNTCPTTAPAGYLQIVVGSTAFYMPFWA